MVSTIYVGPREKFKSNSQLFRMKEQFLDMPCIIYDSINIIFRIVFICDRFIFQNYTLLRFHINYIFIECSYREKKKEKEDRDKSQLNI